MRRTAVSLVLVALLGAALVAPAHASPQRWSTCGRFILVDTIAFPGAYWTRITDIAHVSPTEAWATGYVYGADLDASFVLRWDGWSWDRVAIPRPPTGTSLRLTSVEAAGANDVWLGGAWGGHPAALHWDGSRFVRTAQPAGLRGEINDIAAIPGTRRLWAVGGTDGGSLLERWNGESWHRVASPDTNGPAGHIAAFRHQAFVTGDSGSGAWALRWTGDRWVRADLPHPDGLVVRAIDGRSPGALLAVGDRNFRGEILRWDHGWRTTKRLDRPSSYTGVAFTSVGPWVTGFRETDHTTYAPFAMHRSGDGWQTDPAFVGLPESAQSGGVVGTPHDLWTFANDFSEGPNAYLFHRC